MDTKATINMTNLTYSIEYCRSHSINIIGIYDYLAIDIKYAPEIVTLIHKVLSTASKTRWGIVFFAIKRICIPMTPRLYYGMLLQTFSESFRYSSIKNSISLVNKHLFVTSEDKKDEIQIEISKLRRRIKEIYTQAASDKTGDI